MNDFCRKCMGELPENAKFCPQCGAPAADVPRPGNVTAGAAAVPAPKAEKTTYDVFLSYSHRDSEVFGGKYIKRIRDEIESALKDIVEEPKVFLDVDALDLGDEWHSKIMECLRQCKVFICLVSEDYLKSEYCVRERLWWNAKQTQDGRLFDGLYPVYYVKLADDLFSPRQPEVVRNLAAIQTKTEPWFEFKKSLQEDFIRLRLQEITGVVREKMNSAKKAYNSFCSVMPPLCDIFVGRVTELRELHEMCSEGKYPVIHAAGGVGKTELSIAYAYGFADRYPGGRYLIRMEGVKDWETAFEKLLYSEGQETKDAQSMAVWRYFGIDELLLSNCDLKQKFSIARNALYAQAEKKGRLLLLLDNVDDEHMLQNLDGFTGGFQLPSNIHILATTRLTLNRSAECSFQPYPADKPLGNLRENEAFEMLCRTAGEKLYPFDMRKPPERETDDAEYHASREIIRYLECHAWSMEIVSAFMQENYDPDEFNFAMELEALRKNGAWVEDNGEGKERHHPSFKPEGLLEPTIRKLVSLPYGAEMLELAVFASCFKADDIPVRLLKEYCQHNFPKISTPAGVPLFTAALKKLQNYHILSRGKDICKMHRLTRLVLGKQLPDIRTRVESFADHCGKAISADYWYTLIESLPDLKIFSPFRLNDWEWGSFLKKRPDLEAKCPFKSLGNSAWVDILTHCPQYADRCPWEKFSGDDWAELLKDAPQYAEKCSWDKIDISRSGWIHLLDRQPQFADKLPADCKDGGVWFTILENRRDFDDRCPWNEITAEGSEWASLLKKRPDLAGRCPFDRFDGDDWAAMLSFNPEYADRCPWSKIDISFLSWMELLGYQPQFADKLPADCKDGGVWFTILENRRDFDDRCPWNEITAEGSEWAFLLRKRPDLEAKCPFKSLGNSAWVDILTHCPQYADRCPWEKFSGDDWAKLLEDAPQFAEKCSWDKIDISRSGWIHLLRRQPQFADKLPADCKDGGVWFTILENRRDFDDRCPWNEITAGGWEWAFLLRKRPDLADRCPFDRLEGDE